MKSIELNKLTKVIFNGNDVKNFYVNNLKAWPISGSSNTGGSSDSSSNDNDNVEDNNQSTNTSSMEFIDLGLPSGTLWAIGNLTHNNKSIFLWVSESEEYSFGDLSSDGENWNLHTDKYQYSNNTTSISGSQYDLAHSLNIGQLPTIELFKELINNCTRTFVLGYWVTSIPTDYSKYAIDYTYTNKYRTASNQYYISAGNKYTSNINGKTIFFPLWGSTSNSFVLKNGVYTAATGNEVCNSTTKYELYPEPINKFDINSLSITTATEIELYGLTARGQHGSYWTGNPYADEHKKAYACTFTSGGAYPESTYEKYLYCAIRPVKNANVSTDDNLSDYTNYRYENVSFEGYDIKLL